jgi:hypothetical protein
MNQKIFWLKDWRKYADFFQIEIAVNAESGTKTPDSDPATTVLM